jgi:hypothetical protein
MATPVRGEFKAKIRENRITFSKKEAAWKIQPTVSGR